MRKPAAKAAPPSAGVLLLAKHAFRYQVAGMASIGTPYSPSSTRVAFLGSGELGKEVVIELQRLAACRT